jgi:hypothetical protein
VYGPWAATNHSNARVYRQHPSFSEMLDIYLRLQGLVRLIFVVPAVALVKRLVAVVVMIVVVVVAVAEVVVEGDRSSLLYRWAQEETGEVVLVCD